MLCSITRLITISRCRLKWRKLFPSIFGLFASLSHAIEDDYNKSHKKLQSKIDSKLQHMIRKHKQELGITDDHEMAMQ